MDSFWKWFCETFNISQDKLTGLDLIRIGLISLTISLLKMSLIGLIAKILVSIGVVKK